MFSENHVPFLLRARSLETFLYSLLERGHARGRDTALGTFEKLEKNINHLLIHKLTSELSSKYHSRFCYIY